MKIYPVSKEHGEAFYRGCAERSREYARRPERSVSPVTYVRFHENLAKRYDATADEAKRKGYS